MTIWTPRVRDRPGPVYQAIADAIADDVTQGTLGPGDRLPTQRELASALDVALTTVTRAYAEAERRGLVKGEVGRGTFVRGWSERGEQRHASEPTELDLGTNAILPYAHIPDLLARVAAMMVEGDAVGLLGYHPHGGRPRHREAGAAWMNRAGVRAEPERVVQTSGAQHAMAVILATITTPGDTVLVEELTYSGMKSLAHLLRLRLHALPLDGEGIRPDGLRDACTGAARALYCIPTLHNPTAAVMSPERRREILEITQQLGLAVIEDDSYGYLVPEVTPLAASSDDVYYICGASKSIAPGFRVGYLRAPVGMVDRLEAAVASMVYFTSSLLADVVAQWINDGTADAVVAWKRQELAARQEIARRVLVDSGYRSHPRGQHGWLTLPEPWTAYDFVAQAAMRGVRITPSGDYVVARTPAPHAARVCVGAVPTRRLLERGLTTLAEILAGQPEPRPVRA